MHKDRIKIIHHKNKFNQGSYILYWMQQSMRIHYNHALEYAIDLSNQKNLPLVIVFNILPTYPEANLRHYQFMLEGLKELNDNFNKRKPFFCH